MEAALISAAAAIIVVALTSYLTKAKEREVAWRAKKLDYYEQFIGAVSGISGGVAPPNAKIDFANAVNTLHLFASQNVVDALHVFCDTVSESKSAEYNVAHQVQLWSKLVWHIRADLGDAPSKPVGEFEAILWSSGVGTNVKNPGDAIRNQG